MYERARLFLNQGIRVAANGLLGHLFDRPFQTHAALWSNRLTFSNKSYIVGFVAEVLGNFEQAVLLSVLRLGEDAYGRAIFAEVQTRLDRDVAAGAVHSTLNRLEGKGLLTSSL